MPDLFPAIALRHTLHQLPEPSGGEAHTLEAIQAFLAAHTTLEILPMDGWRGRTMPHAARRAS